MSGDGALTDRDAALRELGAIQDRLISLPDDAFAERYELQTRRAALRDQLAEANAGADVERPTPELEAELAALRAQAEEIRKLRIDVVKQAGGGRTGEMNTRGATAMNRQIDEAHGRPAIIARIARIEAALAERAGG